MKDSRMAGLHTLSISERIDVLQKAGWLTAADAETLKRGRQVLRPAAADRMVENSLATFGLPLAIAPNFIVNGRAYLVPMVVEEPSVVAGLSAAARLALPDGFSVTSDAGLLAGQIHITGIADSAAAILALQQGREEILARANAVHPRLVRYGGGARDIDIRTLDLPNGETAIAVHILVATGDAMGANIVNTICESLAPHIAGICGGEIALRILSNLADRSLVTARVRFRLDALATAGYAAERVRDRIIMASDIAYADAYRAATHNKGIMNGVDAVAIATGNDWRAIEAGAHAFASLSGRYRPLTRWTAATSGELSGELRMPLRAAIIGGTAGVNPAAMLALRISGVASAQELSELMAAVGLAQNFAAIKALVTSGIQDGHMKLHARHKSSVAEEPLMLSSPQGSAAGKVIVLGEHAVVYGKRALALPIPHAVTAKVTAATGDIDPYRRAILERLREELALDVEEFGVEVSCRLPLGMGLGSSAAIAVAIIRAVSSAHDLGLDDDRVNSIALSCEELAHGTPSGIDNTIATFAVPMLFNNADGLRFEELQLVESPPMLIAFSSQPGLTQAQVSAVSARRAQQPKHYAAVFDAMDDLSVAGAAALQRKDYVELGALMNICHGLLNAIEVSTAEIEYLVDLARSAGAAGAKLTGAGGGGAVLILCPDAEEAVREVLTTAGIRSMLLSQGG